MSPAQRPPQKEVVRKWMQGRQADRKPIPALDEIRRQLGWGMLPNNDTKR